MAVEELKDCKCTVGVICREYVEMQARGVHELSEDCWCDPRVIHVRPKRKTPIDSFPAKRGETP